MELIRRADVVQILGVNPVTVWNWVNRGKLTPVLRIGRESYFDRDSIEAFAKTGVQPPNGEATYLDRLAQRFWAKVDKSGECWLWTASKKPCGYGQFGVGGAGSTPAPAHRVAYELAYGPIPPGLFVCHHCDVRLCVNPSHLFVGTHQDNMKDAVAKGRVAKGEKHYKWNPARHKPAETR